MNPGVVLVRTADPYAQLQALRTTLSLSLGDRPADLLVVGEGVGALAPSPGTEAAQCLETLKGMSVSIELDAAGAGSLPVSSGQVVSHADLVRRLATADFVQVF